MGISVSAGAVTKEDVSSNELSINTVVPTIELNPISSDGYINAAEKSQALVLTGSTTADIGSTVTVTGLDGNARTATVLAGPGSSRIFSVTLTSAEVAALSEGIRTVQASVVNAFGLTGNTSGAVDVDTTRPDPVDPGLSLIHI